MCTYVIMYMKFIVQFEKLKRNLFYCFILLGVKTKDLATSGIKQHSSSRKRRTHDDKDNDKTGEESGKQAVQSKRSNSVTAKEANRSKNSCQVCEKSMKKEEDLFFHLHKNHSDHFCFWCNLFKSNTAEMKEHKERCPPDMDCRRKCHFCSVVVQLGNDFEDHVINCHGPKDHLCSHCQESFSSLLALNDHQKKHKVCNGKECLICRRNFPTEQELDDHMSEEHVDDKTDTGIRNANSNIAEGVYDGKAEVKENHENKEEGTDLFSLNHSISKESSASGNGKDREGVNGFVQEEDELDLDDDISDADDDDYDDDDRDDDNIESDEEIKDSDSNLKVLNRKKKTKAVENVRKKSITCKFLEKKSKNQNLLQKYNNGQAKIREEITCRLCKLTFMNRYSEIRHMLQTHNECFCLWCDKAFTNEAEKDAHDTNCTDDGQNKQKRCHVCPKKLANRVRYESHFLTVHGEDYNCSECDSVFASHYLLRRHERLHEPDEDHQCPYCRKMFNREINMVKHLRLIHKVVKPKAEKKEAFPCECQVCHEGFYSRTALAEHIKVSHMDEINQKIVDNPKYTVNFHENLFLCKKCGKGYPNEDEQAIHMASHLGILNKNNSYICDVCGKVFHQKNLFNAHRDRHTEFKLFPCPKCEKKFHVRTSLVSHLQTHRIHKDFVCDICGKAFKSQPSLRMHSKRHNMDRCHLCKYCNRTFRSYDGLKYHWVVNHPEEVRKRNLTIFPCAYCDKVLATKTQLDRHLAKHGMNKNYACEICNNKFSTVAQLNSHIKNSHARPDNILCNACDVYFHIPSKMLRHMRTQKHNENCLKKNIDPSVFYEMLAKLEKQMVESVDLTQYRAAKTSTKYRRLYQEMGGDFDDKTPEIQTKTELMGLLPNNSENPESVTLDLSNVQYISQLPKEVLQEVEISDSDQPLRSSTEVIVYYDEGSSTVGHSLDAQAVETLQSILSLSNQ